MRVLVTGASGFVGYHVARHLEHGPHEILALWRTQAPVFGRVVTRQVDLLNPKAIEEIVRWWSPTHIVHCAALASTPVCEKEPERALHENFTATQNLLRAAMELGHEPPFFVYLSTDLVFDGTKGWYCETDVPHPIMVYGKTKRAAEEAVELSYQGEWAIVRSALVYGPPTPLGRGGFLRWLIRGLQAGACELFVDEYRSPVFAADLAQLIESVMITRRGGIWHAAGPERLSRFEIGQRVAEILGLTSAELRPASLKEAHLEAPRPADVSLDISKARSELGFNPNTMNQNLAACREMLLAC